MLNVLSESCLESENVRLYEDPSQGVFPLIFGIKINSFEVSRPLLDPPIAEAIAYGCPGFGRIKADNGIEISLGRFYTVPGLLEIDLRDGQFRIVGQHFFDHFFQSDFGFGFDPDAALHPGFLQRLR